MPAPIPFLLDTNVVLFATRENSPVEVDVIDAKTGERVP
jgi:hypothetical protein